MVGQGRRKFNPVYTLLGREFFETQPRRYRTRHLTSVCVCLLLLVGSAALTVAQPPASRSEPMPQPAIPAILSAFDKYEIVAMPEAHGMKDVDDFILSLLRDPAFPGKVNDIAIECGNSLYQPILDRYISGEDVPFSEVRKVWRNTTQPMCGTSLFFEEFFPLVRAINQKLPATNRVRVLAADPPVDWDKVKSFDDILRFPHRDAFIASVMKKEVLSKHRKALMLFGSFHTFHRVEASAVSMYERDYPGVTFVIFDLSIPVSLPGTAKPFVNWPVPSLVPTKGNWLGTLDLSHFISPPVLVDEVNCEVHREFPKQVQKPMQQLVDAFLYLGPPDLRLKEQIPADVAMDLDYQKELQRRQSLPRMPGAAPQTSKQLANEVNADVENPLVTVPPPPDASRAVQSCLDRKKNRDGKAQ